MQDALRLGAISFDAVKHLLLCRIEGRPPRLDFDLYPYLPRVSGKTTFAGVSLFRIYRPENWEFFRIYSPDFQGH